MVRKVAGNKKAKKYKKSNVPIEIPAIVVECPSGNKLQYVDDWDFVEIPNNNNNIEDPEDTEDVVLSGRRNVLRRNSISLPNLEDFQLQIIQSNEVRE